ncbi:MAG: hypothetical protein SCH98_06805 [Deferrisomatales bacterium]|nr:hypothetical protein [Deferrisomatales bacterium]
MAELPEAFEVVLRRFRPAAPPFHRHIARARLLGRDCRVGDRVVVYEVCETRPDGPVVVTQATVLRFE